MPEYEKRWARYARPVNSSWRMFETAVSVRSGLHYLYRAVDKFGKSVASVLRPDRGMESARDFFREAVATNGFWSNTVNLDGNAVSHKEFPVGRPPMHQNLRVTAGHARGRWAWHVHALLAGGLDHLGFQRACT